MANLTNKISELGKKMLISVGKNNKPTYTVMAIATANGIFKPISSLTDKKEKPEARKYAALREFLTEVVAVPTYWSCGVGASVLGGKLFKNNPEKKSMAKANMMFLGVCTAAVFVIPALCSLVLNILDKAVKKEPKFEPAKLNKANLSLNTQINPQNTNFGNIMRPNMSSFVNRGGLKI